MKHSISVILAGAWLAAIAVAHADAHPDSQAGLTPAVNTGGEALQFDWPMIRIGTAEYVEGPTGVTVFHFGRKVLGAVDVRGGAPGTVNAAWLDIGYDLADLDAVVFAGGSWYGLEAATAVGTAIKDDGFRTGAWDSVALSVGSIIYDFGGRRLNEIYPDKRLAQAAFRAAEPGLFRNGAAGAGRMAMTGYMFGCRAHSGQGGAFRQLGDLKIAAFVVANAWGVVTGRDGRVAACYPEEGWSEDLEISDLLNDIGADPARNDGLKQNTTVSLVVVNRAMAAAELKRLAVQVHTSMARGLQPFATVADGDVLYAVSTGEVEPASGDALDLPEIGSIASELMWDAILASVPEQPRHVSPDPDLTIPAAQLRKYAGDYRFSSFVSVRVIEAGGKLSAQAAGERDAFAITRDRPVELHAAARNVFVVPGRYPLTLEFRDDGALIVNPGRWQQRGTRR